MRNLKKILALVLAFLMSLSLMATAGATDFPDDDKVSDTYRQAVEVLSELGVFNGDQNGQFNPDQPINRAEVAAILYRIATGDIGLEGNKTYAPYKQFPDVNAEDWYAGYVTYCGNAGYIKGRSNGEFDAKSNVTGYEVLAMILRAVGYDKQNEFVGSDWQLHTASLAREKGVLANVLEDSNVKLSEAATREVVAELLFRASLLPQVTYNAATLSYVESGETLAKQNLDMERVEGVAVANEYADLNDWYPLDAGITRLETEDGTVDLEISTGLDILGERRWAYVQHGTRILGNLEDPGNTVLENEGANMTVAKLAGSLKTSDAVHYVNFSEYTEYTSEILIRYAIDLTALINRNNEAYYNYAYLLANVNDYSVMVDSTDFKDAYILRINNVDGNEHYFSVNDGGHLIYNRTIHIGKEVTDIDQELIFEIFDNAAGRYENNSTVLGSSTFGQIMVGTQTSDDISDSRDWTYNRFVEEYLNPDTKKLVTEAGNGEWLKIVDHDNDGKADYIFRTWYIMAEITGYNTRTDLWSFSNDENLNAETGGYYPVFLGAEGEDYEPAVGDVIVYSLVDGQALIRQARSVEDSVVKYNYPYGTTDESIDTTAGENYERSDIYNQTTMGDDLSSLPYSTPYILYFDEFGYVRAYKPVDSDKHYGVLTEMYTTTNKNSIIITDTRATAELGIPVEDSNRVLFDEYNVVGGTSNVFMGIPQQIPTGVANLYNYLQRAIAHLSTAEYDERTVAKKTDTNVWLTTGNTTLGAEFDYNTVANNADGKYYSAEVRWSATNLALYSIDEEDNATLSSAASFAYDKNNNRQYYADLYDAVNKTDGQDGIYERYTRNELMSKLDLTDTQFEAALDKTIFPVYEYDYVMLDEADGISAGQREWQVHAADTTRQTGDDTVLAGNTGVMSDKLFAVDDTEFFVVTVDEDGRATGADHFIGFQNLPAISKTTKDGDPGNIQAVYAVGKNTSYNVEGKDYWVAEAIVIEILDSGYASYDKLVLAYGDNFRRYRTTDHSMAAIDCDTGELVTVEVTDSWDEYNTPGFYALYGVETDGDLITATSAIRLESSESAITRLGLYIENGIYAGVATYVDTTLDSRSDYLTVDLYEDGSTKQVTMGKDVPWYSIWSKTGANQTLTCDLMSKPDYEKLKALGHELIWVTNSRGSVVFVVDTSFIDPDYLYTSYVPAIFLNKHYEVEPKVPEDIYNTIIQEQVDAKAPDYGNTATIKIEAYLNGVLVDTITAPDDAIKANTPEKGQYTIDASEITYNTNYVAVRLDVKDDTKAGTYTSCVQLSGGDIVITGVKGTVTVAATLAHNSTEKSLTIKPATGDTALLDVTDVSINGSALASNSTISSSSVDAKLGSKIYFEFTTVTATYPVGLYSVNVDSNGATPYQATKVGTDGDNTVWGVTYYMPTDCGTSVVIEVSGAAASANYRSVNVSSGFEVVNAPAIAGNDNLPTSLTIKSTDDMTGKVYEITSIKVGDKTLEEKASGVLSADEYRYDANTGVITFGTTAATGNISIEVKLVPKTFTVTVSDSGIVDITGTIPDSIEYGKGFTFTVAAKSGWSNIKLAAGSTGATMTGNTVKVENATGNIDISFTGDSALFACDDAAAYLETEMANGKLGTLQVTGERDALNQLLAKATALLSAKYPDIEVTNVAFDGTKKYPADMTAGTATSLGDVQFIVSLRDKNETTRTADTEKINVVLQDSEYAALQAAKTAIGANTNVNSSASASDLPGCDDADAIKAVAKAYGDLKVTDENIVVSAGTPSQDGGAKTHTVTLTLTYGEGGTKTVTVDVKVTCDAQSDH